MHIFQIPFIMDPVFWDSTIWHHKSGLDPSFAIEITVFLDVFLLKKHGFPA